jgi:hypothetical protein
MEILLEKQGLLSVIRFSVIRWIKAKLAISRPFFRIGPGKAIPNSTATLA